MKNHTLFILCMIFACQPDKNDDGDTASSDQPAPGPDQLATSDSPDTLDPVDEASELTGASLAVAVVPATGTLAIDDGMNLMQSTDSNRSYGQATPIAMKYYFQSIQICEDMEITGTGYSNPKNCLEVYSTYGEGENPPDYETFFGEQAKAFKDNYVDLMNPEDLKKLAGKFELNENHAREYKYGLVNWYRPIFVKAEVELSNSETLYTKDSPIITRTQGDWDFKMTAIDQITTGPAEDMLVIHDNGGAWFKFAQPFKISADDIADQAAFQLDLTFNPKDLVKGQNRWDNYPARGFAGPYPEAEGADEADADNGYAINIPMLSLTPIAHRADQALHNEIYVLKNDGDIDGDDIDGLNPIDVRVQIYYLEGDLDRTIMGVNFERLFVNGTVKDTIGDLPQAFFVEQTGDKVTFLQHDNTEIFSDFVRLTTVGDTGEVIHNARFDDGYIDIPFAYELIEDGPVQ